MLKKQKGQNKNGRYPRLLGLGQMAMDLTLNLPPSWLEHYKIYPDTIKTAKDLEVITKNKDLWDTIQISSTDQLINTLLYLNKTSVTKYFVELITLNAIQLSAEEEFLKEMLTYVTEHHLIFLLETPILKTGAKITFHIKSEKTVLTSIPIGTYDPNVKLEQPDLDLFSQISCEYKEFDYLLTDLESLISLNANDLQLSTVYDFFRNLVSNYKKLKIVARYPNIIKSASLVNLDFITAILDILSVSDICLFEKKDALSLFNMVNNLRSEDPTVEEYDEKYLEFLFLKYTKLARKGHPKVGLFLDEFQKVTIIEKGNEGPALSNKEYDIQLYPKINHSNQKLIDEYRKILTVNQPLLSSIFFGGFLAKFLIKHSSLPAYLAGTEITKKTLEILKNNLDIPSDPQFFHIKLQKHKVEKEVEKENMKSKEQNFVLDCVNRNTSSLKFYNPLYDDHLNTYFSLGTVRKQLKDKGFINTDGFVLFDSVYRTAMERSSSNGHHMDEKLKEKSLLNAIRNNNLGDSLTVDVEQVVRRSPVPTNRKLPALYYDVTIKKQNLYTTKEQQRGTKKLKPIVMKNSEETEGVKSDENDKTKSKEETKQPKQARTGRIKVKEVAKPAEKISPEKKANKEVKKKLETSVDKSNSKPLETSVEKKPIKPVIETVKKPSTSVEKKPKIASETVKTVKPIVEKKVVKPVVETVKKPSTSVEKKSPDHASVKAKEPGTSVEKKVVKPPTEQAKKRETSIEKKADKPTTEQPKKPETSVEKKTVKKPTANVVEKKNSKPAVDSVKVVKPLDKKNAKPAEDNKNTVKPADEKKPDNPTPAEPKKQETNEQDNSKQIADAEPTPVKPVEQEPVVEEPIEEETPEKKVEEPKPVEPEPVEEEAPVKTEEKQEEPEPQPEVEVESEAKEEEKEDPEPEPVKEHEKPVEVAAHEEQSPSDDIPEEV